MTRAIPQACVAFIKEHEQCILFVYDDAYYPPRPALPSIAPTGRLTAGYGHTDQMTAGLSVSQEDADAWLLVDLLIAAERLETRIGRDVVDLLTVHQYAALISFVFNLGASPDWTIWKRLKENSFDQVPLEMMKFVNQTKTVDGKEVLVKVSGLVSRRAAEVQLWATDEPGTIAATPSSSVTRSSATPPTPGDPVPPSRTGAIIAAAASSVAAAPVVINQVATAIQPYALSSSTIQRAIALLAIVSAGLTVLAMVLAWLNKKHQRS